MATRAPRRRLAGGRGCLLVVALLLVVAVVPSVACRVITAPWSFGIGGREALTRTWVGPMQARQGAQYGLYLDLDYRDPVRLRGRSRRTWKRDNLQGRATICTRTGERFDYSVSGRADRAGTLEALRLEYGDPKLSQLNLRLSGPWSGSALTVTTTTNPFLPDGRFDPQRTRSSADPDDAFGPIALGPQDRTAFDALCQVLRQSG